MDEDQDPHAKSAEIPVLTEVVEFGEIEAAESAAEPIDVDALATRLTDEISEQIENELRMHLEARVNQAIEASLAQIRRDVRQILQSELGRDDED